jgi:chitin deacetylase
MFAPILFALLSVPFSAAFSVGDHSAKRSSHDHDHTSSSLLPGTWYHDDDHQVHSLFKRQGGATDGVTYAQVGSPAWAAGFPTGVPDSTKMPQAWKAALAAAVAAGKIPNIPIPADVNDNPVYPTGADPMSPQICSSYYKCRAAGDMWDAPAGKIGIGFDDGPSLVRSPQFLT